MTSEPAYLDLNGFYKYNGKVNKLDGQIEIHHQGNFKGNIYDYGSRSPEQIIRGHIAPKDNVARLVFLKFPQDNGLSNLLYQLECPITERQPFSFRRKFKGTWTALPYKMEYNEDYNMFMIKFDSSIKGIGDEAEIEIFA